MGAFLIFNTFSITVAQRTREFGMLRTLGASRRQVLASVVLEAMVLAVLGSVLGVPGGIGLAGGINALFKAFGIDLPNTGTVIETRTIVVSLLIVGIVVTLRRGDGCRRCGPRASRRMAALHDAEAGRGRAAEPHRHGAGRPARDRRLRAHGHRPLRRHRELGRRGRA